MRRLIIGIIGATLASPLIRMIPTRPPVAQAAGAPSPAQPSYSEPSEPGPEFKDVRRLAVDLREHIPEI